MNMHRQEKIPGESERSKFERELSSLKIGMTKNKAWDILGYEYNITSTSVSWLGKIECCEPVGGYPHLMLYFLDGKLESWMEY